MNYANKEDAEKRLGRKITQFGTLSAPPRRCDQCNAPNDSRPRRTYDADLHQTLMVQPRICEKCFMARIKNK